MNNQTDFPLEASTNPSQNRERSYNGSCMTQGVEAEKIVMEWLSKNPFVIGISDLRNLKVMREADVDCSLSLLDGRVVLVEIKSDRHLGVTGNMLFECLRINHTCSSSHSVTLGWSARSPAQWLLFYAKSIKAIYQIEMNCYRIALQNYTKENRKITKLDYVPTDEIKSTLNILIPIKYIEAMPTFKIHKL